MSGIQKPGSAKRGSSLSLSSPITPSSQSRIPLGGKKNEKNGGKKQPGKEIHDVPGSDINTPASSQEQQEESLDVTAPPTNSSTSHRDLSKCPCEQSKSSWKIDCSRCKQFWHVDCLNLQGLSQGGYNKLTEYLCPFCYVAPVSTVIGDSSICFVCKNTLSLQQSNSQHEVSLAAEKFKSIDVLCAAVSKVEFESLTEQLDRVSQIDLRLKHLLLTQEEHKEQQEQGKKVEDTVLNLQGQISLLQDEIKVLVTRPGPEQKCSSSVNDELIANLSHKLDTLCAEEPKIASELMNLKTSVDALASPAPAPEPLPSCPPTPQVLEPLPTNDSALAPVSHSASDFIDSELEQQVIAHLETISDQFATEGNRSTVSFGEQYTYPGSRSNSTNSTIPIPPVLLQIVEKINSELCIGDIPPVNSCLVNKYSGPTSSLPLHSDNEPAIHPESTIVTVSLGQGCAIEFLDSNDACVHRHECNPCSVYSMTRKSQDIFRHCIDPGSIAEGVRYSLTFRSVDRLNRNSTCIIGDSNTKGLKFGTDPKRSFGKLLPGKQFHASTIEDIDPYVCCGYKNVVVMCGINNIRKDQVRNENDLRTIYNMFSLKLNQIQSINKNCHIYIVPILPTKRSDLNRRAVRFNRFIIEELVPANFGVTLIRGIDDFLDENGLLDRELSRDFTWFRRPDFLHLNLRGLAQLARLIKNSILFRNSGGVRRSRRTREVDGTSYRDVVASGTGLREGYQTS